MLPGHRNRQELPSQPPMSVLMPPVTTFAASVFFVTLRFYIILTVKRKKKNSKHSDSALATVNLTYDTLVVGSPTHLVQMAVINSLILVTQIGLGEK